MTRIAGTLRRLVWAVWVCTLLAPHAVHAGDRSVLADFDGDGQRDRATLDGLEPSVLRVWLSSTHSTAIVRGHTPIAGIAARDLDGDLRAELIAGGASTGLQVWTRHRTGFAPFTPRPTASGTLGPPRRHNIEEDSDEAPAATTSTGSSLVALALSPQPRAPSRPTARLLSLAPADPHAPERLAPVAPRPPPASR